MKCEGRCRNGWMCQQGGGLYSVQKGHGKIMLVAVGEVR